MHLYHLARRRSRRRGDPRHVNDPHGVCGDAAQTIHRSASAWHDARRVKEIVMKRVFVALFVLLGVASVVRAQSTAEGTIRGQVKDQQGGVLPGVSIAAASPTVAGSFLAVTDAEGRYRLLNLPPGTYTVTAELSGFAKFSRENVVIRAGLNVLLDVVLAVGTLAETITVSGESPMLETEKAVQAVNISGEFQRQLPLGSRRDFSEFLEVTPGVTSRTFESSGGMQYMMRGTYIENHVVQFDGADVGSFRQAAALYVGANSDMIEDTQVKTGGVDASQPLGVGLIINLATQSGTNRLKGAASTIYQARSWNANNNPTGTSAVYDIVQPDISLGGPIKKDRLFFFGAYRYTHRNSGISRTQKQLTDLKAIEPTFSPFDNLVRNKYYYVKGTAPLSPNHQVYAFVQRDFNPEAASFPNESKRYSVNAFGGNALGARWSGVWRSSLTTKVLASWNNKSINGNFSVFDDYTFPGPAGIACNSVFAQSGQLSCSATLAVVGGTGSISALPAEKTTIQADVTYYKRGLLGSHELQTGFFAQPHLHYKSTTRYLNDGFIREDVVLRRAGDPASGLIPYHRQYVDAQEVVTRELTAQDYGFYVQDGWKPTPRMTINAGVRFDRVSATDNLFNLEVQNHVEVGPRFGATYVLTNDQKNIVRFSAGRIHDFPQAMSGYLPTAGTNIVGRTDLYDLNLDGVFEARFDSPSSTALSSNRTIDPDRHQFFIDEFIVGYRRQFPGQVSLDASWVRRYYKDLPALVEINGIYDGSVFRGYKDVTQNEIFLVTNDRWTTPVYTGLEFTAAKRTNSMQVLATYSRQWQHLDGTWRPNEPAAFIQPDHFPNDKNIGWVRGNETNSFSGAGDAFSTMWQKHILRIAGSYMAPWGVHLASSLSFQSGPYSGPIIARLAAADPRFGPATVGLSNGRVVPNPLATTLRFAYATRGEGQIQAPHLIVWNIRFGRTFRFKGQQIETAFDIFNVTNRGTPQQFLSGGNQLFSANYAIRPDGTFQGTSLQYARSGQLLLKWSF